MPAKAPRSAGSGRPPVKEKTSAPGRSPAVDPILTKLQGVYGFMTENRLDTVEVEEPGLKMRLVRRRDPAQIPVPVFAGGAPAATPAAPAAQTAEAAAPAGVAAVRSSMMGIFYRAPTPSSPPFTKEGDSVKTGQVLCIIEAMKVFNELKAEFSGTLVKVLADNGKPVKSGQDIFWIQRS